MHYNIRNPYLWLPVKKTNAQTKLFILAGESMIHEIDICLGDTDCDFYTYIKVSQYIGSELQILGEASEEQLGAVLNRSEIPETEYPYRPKLHYAPNLGWINDPNGFCYIDGKYHLYYQYNPYGVVWGNMQWGHAVSEDLLHWEEKDIALTPDEHGVVYSGCAVSDNKNLLGYGKDTLLYYYTAAGGRNEWSVRRGELFTQRLAYSNDGGNTLHKSDKFILEHIVDENRDPKILYHEETNAYIMLLYLTNNEFAIYRSEDLVNWEQTQVFEAEAMWECPNLVKLTVDNDCEASKYVFFTADGYYMTGSFDGYQFIPESKVIMAYATTLPYAAQTCYGTGSKVISIPWLRTKNTCGNYCGLMGLPMELSLGNRAGEYKLRFHPTRKYQDLARKEITVTGSEKHISMKNKPVELVLYLAEKRSGTFTLQIGKTLFTFILENEEMYVEDYRISFQKEVEITFVIDQEIIEFFGDEGYLYGAVEAEENILNQEIILNQDNILNQEITQSQEITLNHEITLQTSSEYQFIKCFELQL